MYLVLTAVTSSPVFLLATTKSFVFSLYSGSGELISRSKSELGSSTMEAACPSDTPVSTYKITRSPNPSQSCLICYDVVMSTLELT